METTKIEYKNYKFTKASYFGYEILINDADKYINITKLLNLINEEHRKIKKPIKKLNDLTKHDDYKEFEQELKNNLGGDNCRCQELIYELRLGPKANHINGTYIHEDLLNYVLIWADKKYAIKIGRILKELNNNNLDQVNKLVEELKNENNDLKQRSIYVQTDELFDNSKIKLYKLKDSDIYKLSYDQDRNLPKDLYELQEVFVVNSASNILKSEGIKQYFNKGIREFDETQLSNIVNYIKPSIIVKNAKIVEN